MKLAKRVTNRTNIIAFKNSYHGSTRGALSVIGDEYWRNAFRPLLPGIQHLEYNSFEALGSITGHTACVIVETIQGEAGVIVPAKEWMQALSRKRTEAGTLFIVDEIQAGFGRTGKLWGFENFGIVPDILLLGKALRRHASGAFIAERQLIDPPTVSVLGHITTFGGHPVSVCSGAGGSECVVRRRNDRQRRDKRRIVQELTGSS